MTSQKIWRYVEFFLGKQTHPHYILRFDPRTKYVIRGETTDKVISAMFFVHCQTQALAMMYCFWNAEMLEGSDDTRIAMAILFILLCNAIAILSGVCLWTVGGNRNMFAYMTNGVTKLELQSQGLLDNYSL
jgi:heme/copper-type cytochrome/quinol oxidase subunit 4